MKAINLISKDIHPLSPNDSIETALVSMVENKVFQLYVLQDQKIIGMVTWPNLIKHKDKSSIKEIIESDFHYISSEDYIFEIRSKMLEFNLSNLPVLSDDGQFIGCVSEEHLIKFYIDCFVAIESGCIILLSMRKMDYSLEKIAQIVEEQRAVILSSFVSEKTDRNEIYVSIKINIKDPTVILNDFMRYEIEVVNIFSNQDIHNVHKERYNELMHYLNV
jgi:acetoin utilization protein AcuB